MSKPGQMTYSRSEGLWIVRGGIDQLPADSPLALAWQSLPSAWREHPGLFFVTNAALGPWWVHGPDQAGALLDGQSKPSWVPSDIEGQRLRLQALADRFGRMQRFSRSPDKPWQHAITGVQDGAGRRYRLELIKLPHAVSAQGRQGWGADSGIRLAAVYLQSDPGHSARRKPLVRYEYTPQGELAAVHGRDGSLLRRFEYHPTLLGRMSAHAYPGRPNASSYVYDDSGKVIAQVSPGALSYRFDYQKDSTVVTDSLGRSKTLHFEGKEGLRRVVRIEQSDGSAIENKYDGNGNLICATDALGRQTYYSVDVNTGRIDTIASSDGQRRDLYYDRHGNVTDERGLNGVRETRQYDPLGRLTRQTDALGQNTHYRYGDNHSEQPSEIEDARGGVKRLQWNSAEQLASYTDCSGSTVHYRYDRWGQLIEIRGEEGLSQKNKYDPLGRLIVQTDAAGQRTAYRLSQAGDLMGMSAPDGSQVTFERDERGQVTAFNQGGLSQRYQYDPAGRLTMLVNENAAQTVFKYDVMDRLIEQINFDGRAQRYQYDAGGQLIASEDAGQQSAYEYDKAGRLIERQRNQSDGSQYQERYEYDKEGQLIGAQSGTVSAEKETSHNATRVEFKRDRLGRITQETQSMVNAAGATLWRHQVKHQYDLLGNEAGTGLHNLPLLNWQTYGSGHLHGITLDNETLIDFERDRLHREVERSFAGTKVLRKYDSLSRLAGVRGLSQDMHIGRAINRDLHYDAVGQLTQIDTLKGPHQYRYDAARRLIGAQLPGQAGQKTYRFDPAGNRLFADPIQETLSAEEERARWEDLAHKNWNNPDFNLLQPPAQPEKLKAQDRWPDNQIEYDEHWRYSHDRFGNLTEKRGIQNTEENHRYRYDVNQRLIRYTHETAEKTITAHYFYDPFGRRLARQTQESDNKGQPAGEIKTSFYGWDGERLVLTEENGRHIHTIYEPGSFVPLIRIERPATRPNRSLAQKFEQMGGGKVKLTAQDIDLLNRVEPQLRQGRIDKQAAQYLSIAGVTPQMLQELLDPGPAGNDRTIHYYHCDHLGTPIALINEQGQLDWSIELDPWGNVLKEHNPKNLYQPIRFQGQHFDEESGLHYNRYRYYDPKLGRYINQDPIGIEGGINFYGYVYNPLKFIDPLGLDAALVETDETGGWTSFYDPKTHERLVIDTRNDIDPSKSKPGTGGPYSGRVTRCEIGKLGPGYGTTKIYTTDSRYRWIHGGGNNKKIIKDPYAPRQGWLPTLGCTRGQNEDVEKLCKKIQAWQAAHPGGQIYYVRFQNQAPTFGQQLEFAFQSVYN